MSPHQIQAGSLLCRMIGNCRDKEKMENLGKSLQNLRLFGVFPMVRLIQALLVDVIKDIRQQKKRAELPFFIDLFSGSG